MSSEHDSNASAQPVVCAKGCGFFGCGWPALPPASARPAAASPGTVACSLLLPVASMIVTSMLLLLVGGSTYLYWQCL
jgi:hypothetical protein